MKLAEVTSSKKHILLNSEPTLEQDANLVRFPRSHTEVQPVESKLGCRLNVFSMIQPITLFLLVASLATLVSAQAPKELPNLIWMMADDLGYGELGCYGQKRIQTPQLDQMAREGLRFTRFYAGATVCAPSRSVLMTGLHHGHTRVRGNAPRESPWMQALQAEDFTVAELLQQAGYATALIGKWGLGDFQGAESGLPRRQGFDFFYGYLSQFHAHNHFPDFLWRDEKREGLPNKIVPVGDTGAGYATEAVAFADDLFAEEALRFVAEHKDRPFFLYWSLVIPHANNERAVALGDGAQVPDYGPYDAQDWPNPTKGHAAMISRMDQYVGKLLESLREHGIDQKTLVIFTSDNGPHRESRHDPDFFRPTGGLTGFKRSLKDGGIRVPAIAWWPGTIQPNRTSDHVAYFGDWLATAAELAHVTPPAGRDSISFVPTILGGENEQAKHEFLYWEFHEGGFQQAALYQGRWKGIRTGPEPNQFELFDQEEDPGEQTNVADLHPAITQVVRDYLASARSDSNDWPIRWRETK